MRIIGLIFAVLLAVAPAWAEDAPFDPVTGYRVSQYRGVVLAAPPGVARVGARQVARLTDRHAAILIDVVPAEGGVRDAVTGDWRLARPAATIPGAHWFPEAGRGHLEPAIARWFADGVSRLHRADPQQPLIVFCLADCWMSWNAALRLHRAGYTHVLWFAEGADGWRDLGHKLAPVLPYKASR